MTIEFLRPEFHASVAEVRRTADQLTRARARASGQVDGLLDTWHGAAAQAFAEAWDDWRDAAARVATSLDGIADSLDAFQADLTATDGYAAADLEVLTGRLS